MKLVDPSLIIHYLLSSTVSGHLVVIGQAFVMATTTTLAGFAVFSRLGPRGKYILFKFTMEFVRKAKGMVGTKNLYQESGRVCKV